MKAQLLGLALLAALGCAQGEAIPDGAVELPADLGGAELPITEQPYLVLSTTDARILPVVTDWAARWSAATGLDIEIGEQGVPVEFATAPLPGYPDPTVELCGETGFAFEGAPPEWVELDARGRDVCAAWTQILGHEMAHAIAGTTKHSAFGVLGDPLEKTAPVMIDPASLSVICETAPCTVFAPEG